MPKSAFPNGYFNSIKVRLNHFLTNGVYLPYSFQFHKGTIKPLGLVITIVFLSNFNSIKVRLNLSQKRYTRDMSLFQFHKGTIKPILPLLSFYKAYLFQFHKGTIKPVA